MKTIILTLIILFNFSCMSAQEVVLKKGKKIDKVEKGTYYKTDDIFLNKFLGVWTYELNDKTFKLEILKKKTEIRGVFVDRIVARYYFDDNSEIYNNDNVFECSAKEYGIDVLEKGKLRFRFWDYGYQKFGELKFELLENGNASFKLEETYNPYNDRKGFSVPMEMTLSKLE